MMKHPLISQNFGRSGYPPKSRKTFREILAWPNMQRRRRATRHGHHARAPTRRRTRKTPSDDDRSPRSPEHAIVWVRLLDFSYQNFRPSSTMVSNGLTDATAVTRVVHSAARRSQTFRTRRARTRSSNVRNGALSPFMATQLLAGLRQPAPV